MPTTPENGAAMKRAAAAFGLLALLAGCLQSAPPPETGRGLYTDYCVICHGAGGQGDGPLAGDLPVPPADLTLLSVRNGGVFPASDVIAQVYGYPGRHLAGAMPEFGPILEGPRVDWVDETGTPVSVPAPLLALAGYLETLQRADAKN